MRKSAEQAVAKAKAIDIKYMLNARLWPNWPVLSLKRSRPEGGLPQLGFMVDGDKPVTVYLGYDLNEKKLEDFEKLVYDGAKAASDDGWMVD